MDLSFLNEASAFMQDYGPLAVLILLILPLMGEDIIIIPAGVLIGHEHLPFWPTFICAYIGAIISDGMWYVICYRYGTPLLHKNWFKRLAHPRRLLQAKHQIEKRGAWLIVTARFVPGSRTSAMIVSGLMHMPFWKFAIAEGACLLVTVMMQLGLGILISHGVGSMTFAESVMAVLGVIAVLLVGAMAMNWWMSYRRTQERAPRSKASWLRRFRKPRNGSISVNSARRALANAATAGQTKKPVVR